MKYNILIGGAAGQGMDTLSILLEKILKRQGYQVLSTKDYMSRIRGGHNFIQIRFGNEPIHSHHPVLDVIVALDKNTIDFHTERLQAKGIILCDESIAADDSRLIPIPMKKIATEVGNPKTIGSVAMGAVLKMFNLPLDTVQEIFETKFEKQTAESNFIAFSKGHQLLHKHFESEPGGKDNHILINSNYAIAIGALAGGVSFYPAYPMSPATSIMTFLSRKQNDAKIIVEQVEDEISAINMALGASYAGVRSMTGSSGGGVALMVEAFSLQGITEIPLVVVDCQRPGPATGLPTRTEQADLEFTLYGGHGEFPRMVIAVRNAEDAFYQTTRALNIADKYQLLVIILTDEYLADATQTIPPFDFSTVSIEKHISSKEDIDDEVYRRYKDVKSGISPRIIPGKIPGWTTLIDSDEHNEYGHITESAEVRIAMVEKRARKLEGLKAEIQEPKFFGAENPETLLIGWGSTYGPLKECVEMLEKDGVSVGALVYGDIWPLPTKLLEKYTAIAKKVVNVEQNYTGQLAKLIRQTTGIAMYKSILKYDGRQISGHEIYTRVKSEVL